MRSYEIVCINGKNKEFRVCLTMGYWRDMSIYREVLD